MKKKEIYISVELKVREFLSQIILAFYLSLKGFRVYLGSKNQIIEMVKKKKNKSGIFFYKGGIHRDLINDIDENIDSYAVLDHEIGPGCQLKQYNLEVPGAFHPQTLKKLDLYFSLNQKIHNVAKNKMKNIRGKHFLTGWPRVDLWKPKYKFLYLNKIIKINKRYKDFILFNSDFANITPDYENEILQFGTFWSIVDNKKKNLKITNNRKLWAKNSYDEFNQFIKFIKIFAKKNKDQNIVIRPHPAENIKTWNNQLSDIKNIYVESPKDDVTPWIYAAKCVLHRGCTTALQSLYMKKPNVFLTVSKDKFKQAIIEKKTTYDLCDKVESIKQLENWIKKIKPINNINKKLFKELGIQKNDSVDNLVKIFQSINMNKTEIIKKIKNKNNIFNIVVHYKNILFSILLRILNNLGYTKKTASNYGRETKIFGGIKVKEVNFYISKLNKKKRSYVKCHQYDDDIVIIENS